MKRTTTIAALLLVTAGLVNLPHGTSGTVRRAPLATHFQVLDSWRGFDAQIDEEIVSALQLDDYINRTYVRGAESVQLYIGYYRSSKKTAAAHSPLVCFPGQGWVTSGQKRTAVPILPGATEYAKVKGTVMTARREQDEIRIFFWFQAWTRTYPSTFEQKLSLMWDRIRLGVEDNALVRISTPLQGPRPADALIEDFLQSFYPRWFEYLNSSPEKP